ncbi:MAG: LptA/OstA family protein [Verrucomicrobiales bacterium]
MKTPHSDHPCHPAFAAGFVALCLLVSAVGVLAQEGGASAALDAAKKKATENADLLRMAQDRFNAELRTPATSTPQVPAKPTAPPQATFAVPQPPATPVATAQESTAPAALPRASLIPEPTAKPAPPTVPTASPDQTTLATAGGIPAPKPPVAKYMPQSAPTNKGMQVTSQRSVMDDKAHMVVFSGDVVVNDTTFHMECDKLEIHLYADGEEPPAKEGSESSSVKKAIATGGMVVIERLNEKGEKEIAKSTMAVFDGPSGDTILSGGPPILQQGGTTIEMLEPSGKIFLSEDGKNRTEGRVTINMAKGPGTGKGNGLSNLNNITGKR